MLTRGYQKAIAVPCLYPSTTVRDGSLAAPLAGSHGCSPIPKPSKQFAVGSKLAVAPNFFEGHMGTAALTVTESKLTVKTGSSSVVNLAVFKYMNSLRKMVLSCSVFVSSMMSTGERDCAGRVNVAGVLCSPRNSVAYSGAAWMLQLVTTEKCEIQNRVKCLRYGDGTEVRKVKSS